MATRSYQFVEMPNGEYVGRYTHFDGYPSGVGKELLKDFNTFEAAVELVNTGEGSTLYETYANARPPIRLKTLEEVISYAKRAVDYLYLMRDGRWYVMKTGSGGGRGFVELATLVDVTYS